LGKQMCLNCNWKRFTYCRNIPVRKIKVLNHIQKLVTRI